MGLIASNKEMVICTDCGAIRLRKKGWPSLLCRSCAQKGQRSNRWKHGNSGTKEYQAAATRRLRAKWIAEGKHPELKRRNTRYRLRRFEKMAGRNCPQLCEVCGNPQTNDLTGWHGGRVTHLCYDHNHKTGKFRGWICSPCNKCLGLVDDDIERLKKLILYLELTNE